MESNIKDSVVFRSPRNIAERTEVAGACVRKLGIKFPALVDRFDNATEKTYTGWPDRIYLINAQGRIVYKSKPGPFGFKAEELKTRLERLLGPAPAATSAAR
jgi:Iodothyronine deiodinase